MTPHQRLETAKAILADDEDGARLLAIAAKHGIDIVFDWSAGAHVYWRCDNTAVIEIGDEDNLANTIDSLTHELRHVEQMDVFDENILSLLNNRRMLTPSDLRLQCQVLETDADAFSLALTQNLIDQGKIRARITSSSYAKDMSYLGAAFDKALRKIKPQKSPSQIYDTAINGSWDDYMVSGYDEQEKNSLSWLRNWSAAPFPYRGHQAFSQKIEDVFDMAASLPVPGGGRITLQDMLDIALKTIRPASYVTFAKMDKDYAPRTGRTPAP